jgi:hypothetical protein
MSKNKIVAIGLAATILIVSLAWALPTFAAAPGTVVQATQDAAQPSRAKALLRLLLVQDEAKVDTLIAGAVNSGKITAEQGAKIKSFWTEHHTQFTRNVILKRLLSARDETKVKAFLDKAVNAGKIQQAGADKIIQMWETLHN